MCARGATIRTSYEPDRDYVEGELIDRNVGEYDHGRIQGTLYRWFAEREQALGIRPVTGLRVQVAPRRFRVPDVCVTLGKPNERFLTKPPFLCVEILSEEDRMSRMMEKIADYLKFGVPYVWVIDPAARKGYVAENDTLRDAPDGILTTSSPDLALAVEELLRQAEA